MLEKEIKIHPAEVGGIKGLYQDGNDTPLTAQMLYDLLSEAPLVIHGLQPSSENEEIILGDCGYYCDLDSKSVGFAGNFGRYKADNPTDPLVKVES